MWLLASGRQPGFHADGSRLYSKAFSRRKSSCQAERLHAARAWGLRAGDEGSEDAPGARGAHPQRLRLARCSIVPASGPALPRRPVGTRLETRLGV